MAETEHITVADTSAGVGTEEDPGQPVSLPVVELLTGRGFITGKSGGGKSILEGTPVHTESGRKPIESVSEGERVLSLNKHTYEQEFREVQATIEHDDDRLLRVTLEDGTELVGTEDHSFLTVEDMEIVPIRGEELEAGTWLPLARELPSAATEERIDLAEYAGDANNTVVNEETIQSGSRTDPRFRELDFDLGKEIGLYIAEGSFDGGMTLQISNIDDDVRAFLDERGYNVYERTCNKGFRPFARFLVAEFGRGAGDKYLANWVFDTPRSFRAGLVSGYIDGDGTVTEKTVTATSKSEQLITDMQQLLRQFGVSSTVREKVTVYADDERRYRRLRVDSFSIPTLASIVDLSVLRKAAQLESLVADREGSETFNSKDMVPNFGSVLNTAAREQGWTERESDERVAGASVHGLTRKQKVDRTTYNEFVERLDIGGRAAAYGQSDIQWKRVAEVEELGTERTVYDLDVAHNDNFVANGVFVHNSNTASVVAEKLLDNGFGLLIVDIDGEYYGLKEAYEILHVGGDEECDIQVTEEHSDKIASLALEQNVPIILDISSFLDEEKAESLLTEVARALFAKAKKQKQPFLLLVEECHEWIPEKGGMGEVGKMLIKIGKRGRKHGLGIVGISQRPADVKKDYITQCDWLVWHRLTWNNDTKVVGRILDSQYADAVEDLDDGEAFMMTHWAEQVRRVQFHRKQTFDAGATPGLDDFERPELKSVSEDLVSELATISEETQATENRMQELREELDRKNSRIAELETELQDARDLQRMAEQFTDALLGHVERVNPGRTAKDEMRKKRERFAEPRPERDDTASTDTMDDADTEPDTTSGGGFGDAFSAFEDDGVAMNGGSEGAETAKTDGASADGPVANGSTPDGTTATQGSSDAALEAALAAVAEDEDVAVESGTDAPAVVEDIRADIAGMEDKTRRMLAYYKEHGPGTPLNAHFSAGGSGDRTAAYARNRTLRLRGLVEHVGRGTYDYRLEALVREESDGSIDGETAAEYATRIERALVDETQ